MKVTKLFTLDLELVELLNKEDNMSGLINDLLHQHFYETPNNRRLKVMKKIQDLKAEKASIAIKEAELSKEVDEIVAREKLAKETKDV